MVEPPCGRAGLGEIADEGADDAALVDAMVLVEAPVFGGDERLLHEVGNVAERHPDAPVAGLEHVGEILAAAVEHGAHARQLLALEALGSGRSAAALLKKSMTWPRSTTGLVMGLVLAELVIGGVEVGEVEAVKGLDVGAYRLGVVQRGR